MEIVFCRHGESEHNEQNLIQGQIDSELTDKGREQAKELSEKLSEESFDAIYSSDLLRATETANIIASSNERSVTETKKLRERDLGILEGEHRSAWDDIEVENSHDWSPEDGESLSDHKNRVEDFLDKLVNEENCEKVLVVSHGGTIKAALMYILKAESRQSWRFIIENCSITRIQYGEQGWMIKQVNSM